MSPKLLLGLVVAFIIGGIYYAFFYPPNRLRHRTEDAVASFNAVFETKDRAKIGEALNGFLTDDAHVKLTVEFVALGGQAPAPLAQDFTKAEFIKFFDNILYSLEDYSLRAQMEAFQLDNDHQGAVVTLPSSEWGDSTSSNYYAGTTINVRYGGETNCNTHMRFEDGKPKLNDAICTIQIRVLPRAGEATGKALNPQELRDRATQ